jgi:hypothetical protein
MPPLEPYQCKWCDSFISRRVNDTCMIQKVKERRRRPEEGEWEPITILLKNLAYIPKSTQNPSLLTRPRPHSYSKAVGPRNRARNCSGDTERC